MATQYDRLVSALELSYDYHSARTLAKEAVANAKADPQKDWKKDELEAVVAAIEAPAAKLQRVLEALGLAEAPKEEPKEAEKADAAGAKDDKKPEAKDDKKPEAKDGKK